MDKMNKKMTVSFILCPFWHTEAPPLGIGYLSAYLKLKGYETFSFDFNIDLYSKKKDSLMIGWDFHLPDIKRYAVFNKDLFKKDIFLNREIDSWVKKVLATNSEVICFSVYFENSLLSLELAKRIKSEDDSKKVIFGGPFCRKNRHVYRLLISSDTVDAFVLGEGEETLLELLETYKKDKHFKLCKGVILKKNNIRKPTKYLEKIPSLLRLHQRIVFDKCSGGMREPIKNLDELPFPDFNDFPLKKYTKKDRVYFLSSRGCIGQCTFCKDRFMWKGFSCRTTKNIFDEMKVRKDQGYNFLRFSDFIINGNLKVLSSLCDLIIKNKLEMVWDGAIKSYGTMDFNFFKKLKKAGYCGGNFSIESGSQEILDRMKKGHKITILEKNLQDMNMAGIKPSINLIVGFPGETEETINQTLGFISRNRKHIFCLASLTPLYVLPESYLSMNYKEYGIKLGDDVWDWSSADGKNNHKWRLKKCKQIYDYVNHLGIKVECDQYKKEMRTNQGRI